MKYTQIRPPSTSVAGWLERMTGRTRSRDRLTDNQREFHSIVASILLCKPAINYKSRLSNLMTTLVVVAKKQRPDTRKIVIICWSCVKEGAKPYIELSKCAFILLYIFFLDNVLKINHFYQNIIQFHVNYR